MGHLRMNRRTHRVASAGGWQVLSAWYLIDVEAGFELWIAITKAAAASPYTL